MGTLWRRWATEPLVTKVHADLGGFNPRSARDRAIG
jgi:hypothetical protein